MDQRDARHSASDTPPPELAALDAWLHGDGERWREHVPSHDGLVDSARSLATLAPPADSPSRRPSVADNSANVSGSHQVTEKQRRRRFPAVLATIAAVVIVALMLAVVHGVIGSRTSVGVSATPQIPQTATAPAPTGQPSAVATASPAVVPFAVTAVDLSVNPTSIAGTTCGSRASFTYSAVFHLPANTAGGTVKFDYTLNNGRSQTPGTLEVSPGATSATYTFVSNGILAADHTYPGTAIVMVTSPGAVMSPPVTVSGSCAQSGAPGGSAPFQVTAVAMSVSPTSIGGMRCGTVVTITYTATFHFAANGPGGTVRFYYTVNNGRGSNPASIAVAPGQTTAGYTFTWSGALPADHTYPEPGGVIVQSPNTINSPLLGPSGTCA